MYIATTLKEFRQQHNLEQDELARLLETTQQTVSNWEKGTLPRAGALRRINHLLNTYKKGEGVPTLPPKPVFNPAVQEIHDISVKSEYETRRAVAESLSSVAATPVSTRSSFIARQRLEGQMFSLLPSELGITCNVAFEHQGLRPRVNFLNDDIVCNVTMPLLPGERRSFGFYLYRTVEMYVMRLMTVRSIQRLLGVERKIYAIVVMVPQETLQQLNPTQAMVLASLHGIRLVLVSSAEQGAAAIESLAEEAKQPTSADDFLEDKDYSW